MTHISDMTTLQCDLSLHDKYILLPPWQGGYVFGNVCVLVGLLATLLK